MSDESPKMDQLLELAESYQYLVIGLVTVFSLGYLTVKILEEDTEEPKMVLAAKRIGNNPEGPFRHVDNLDALVPTIYDGKRTVDEVFALTVKKNSNRRCLGTRELLSEEDIKQPDGKVHKKAVYGKYQWQTFTEVYERIKKVADGLALIGMKPKQKIAIFLETKAEWMIAIQACFRNNYPVVTVYATLGEDGIKHALNETEVTHVITSSTLFNTRLQKCANEIPSLTNIIYDEDIPLASGASVPDTIKMQSFKEVEALGDQNSVEVKALDRYPPQMDDLAIIMYTSGQSGAPKGVLISHSNFVAGCSGISTRLPNVNNTDVYIGYLPLAHVLELAAENILLNAGACVGYSSPLTLTDKSSRIKPGSQGDTSVLKPTLMACVPEIMERMRKSVMQKIEKESAITKKIFNWAYNQKAKKVAVGKDTPLLNRLVFKKTRDLIGGRVRAMLSGGAPCDKQTQQFMNICMCCPVGQGYGLTETCGATSVTDVTNDFTAGRTGPPLSCNDVKLVAWEEGGYSPTDQPPRGEIYIGGPNITQGYYKNPTKTAEDFFVDEDGCRWFKTGDIGQIDEDGCLRIVDRKKDLVKLSHGEYLALGSIEAKLKTSSLIDNVWIYASSLQPYCLAFIVPNEVNLRIELNGDRETDFAAMCKTAECVARMEKAVLETAKATDMQKFAIPKKIHIESSPWTPEEGLVTAAFKLKRKALQAKYDAEIASLYQK